MCHMPIQGDAKLPKLNKKKDFMYEVGERTHSTQLQHEIKEKVKYIRRVAARMKVVETCRSTAILPAKQQRDYEGLMARDKELRDENAFLVDLANPPWEGKPKGNSTEHAAEVTAWWARLQDRIQQRYREVQHSPPPPRQVSAGVGKPPHGLGVCIWMHLVNGTGSSPSLGQLSPGVVKQDKSSGGSVDTTKTRSGPQRVRMSSRERPIGAARGKQPNTEALCQAPPPPPSSAFPNA